MKISVIRFATFIITSLLIFSACQKETTNNITDDVVRIAEMRTELINDSASNVFEYDSQGGIVKIRYQPQNAPSFVRFTVAYLANEIRLTGEHISSISTSIDTIHLYLDGGGRLIKRMQHLYFDYTGDPTYNPRTYSRDTSLYLYDASGFLIKETRMHQDSNWLYVGVETMQDNHSTEVITHTIQNGNLASTVGIKNGTGHGFTPSTGNVVNTSSYLETITYFEYTKAYPNKTDFTNALVLNEIYLLDVFPTNEKYKNLPEKVTISQVQKDPNGTVVATNNFLYTYEFTYDANGYVTSRVNTQQAGTKVKFVYN